VLHGGVDGSEIVAVAVNGIIGSVTRSYFYEGEVAILAMVPPRLFVDGSNQIALIEVSASGEMRLMKSGS
jgi:hypothetical protein